MDLNHARLPIPPLRLGAFVPLEGSLVEGSRTAVNVLLRLLSLLRETAVNQLQLQRRAYEVMLTSNASAHNFPSRSERLSVRYNFPPF
jgi:hypothetical protein